MRDAAQRGREGRDGAKRKGGSEQEGSKQRAECQAAWYWNGAGRQCYNTAELNRSILQRLKTPSLKPCGIIRFFLLGCKLQGTRVQLLLLHLSD